MTSLSTEDNSTAYLEPGFSVNGLVSHLFKKGLLRANTSSGERYFKEPILKPNVFREYLATDKIPDTVPVDFETLTTDQVADLFGLSEAEINSFSTTLDGIPSFSVERSASHPHILKYNNLRLKPYANNPGNSFVAVSANGRVNLLSSTIPFTFASGAYRGRFVRTTESGELSSQGRDVIAPQQLAFIYDYEIGIFTAHDSDVGPYTRNPLGSKTPPAITCYVYKGNYGRLGWSLKNDAIILDETRLLIGKTSTTDPTLIVDISGTAFIETLITRSMATSSDLRLKQDIVDAPINKGVLSLHPCFYRYIERPDAPQEYGLIAQEVEKVAPELVKTVSGYKSVMYDRLGVHLLAIVKEQEERIQRLESALATLLEKQ
jgi:hypothetical protein